jgi:hypothetical protein
VLLVVVVLKMLVVLVLLVACRLRGGACVIGYLGLQVAGQVVVIPPRQRPQRSRPALAVAVVDPPHRRHAGVVAPPLPPPGPPLGMRVLCLLRACAGPECARIHHVHRRV